MIGEGNRFAHAASLAVAELPAQAYNPLFLHGPPGLGKTHLLHAIGNYVQRYGSGLRVRYATIEEFTTGFVDAVRRRRTGDFKDDFRSADVVLIDDVQFLAGRTKTREEFFHTFNALLDSGRQLVITSDRSPEELPGLEDAPGGALPRRPGGRARAAAGRVRRAILAKRARVDGVEVSRRRARRDRAARRQQRAGARGRADPRRGLRVAARASEPTPAWCATCCSRLGEDTAPDACGLSEIIDAAAQEFGVERESLLARDRRPDGRHRPPGRDVPGARAHRAQPARDRPRHRRPQPHHRAARRQPDRAPPCAPTRLCATPSTTSTAASAARRDGRCRLPQSTASFPFAKPNSQPLSTYRQALQLQGQVAER